MSSQPSTNSQSSMSAQSSTLPSVDAVREMRDFLASRPGNPVVESPIVENSVVEFPEPETRHAVAAELLAAMTSPDINSQERARETFIDRGFLEETIRGLRSGKSAAERAADAHTLGLVGSKLTTPHLIAALFDSSPEVCRAAAEALNRIGDPAVRVGPLNAMLASESERLDHLKAALERIRTTEETLREVAEERVRLEAEVQQLAADEQNLFEELIRLIRDEQRCLEEKPAAPNADHEVRLAEFEALRTRLELEMQERATGQPDSQSGDPNQATLPFDHSSAGERRTGDRRSGNEAAGSSPDFNSGVPISTQQSLMVIRNDYAEAAFGIPVPPEVSDPAKRVEAVAGLAMSGEQEAFSLITEFFDDDSPEVCNAAARALYDLEPQRCAEFFSRAIEDGSPDHCQKIGGAMVGSGLASRAVEDLASHDRESTHQALGLLFILAKTGEVTPLVQAIEKHENVKVRQAAVRLLTLNGQSEIALAAANRRLMGSSSRFMF